MSTSILVVGATGNQGRTTIEHLLAADGEYDLYGLTRDAESDRAQAVADRGVTMVEGDLEDPDSLRPHVERVDGVFGVTNYWLVGADRQYEQGTNLADVAADVGVDHFVFSGTSSQGRASHLENYRTPGRITEHIWEQDLPATVLKPVFFMQNFEALVEDVLEDGVLPQPLAEGTAMQMVDLDDIGRAAARAFENPDEFIGNEYHLAGDELTLSEAADAISEVAGIEVHPYHIPIDDAREQYGDALADMYQWFNEDGYDVDLEAAKAAIGFEFTTFDEYLLDKGWENKTEPAAMPGWVKGMQQRAAD